MQSLGFDMGNELDLVPYSAEADWHRLLARYLFCCQWAKHRRVLDLGCGRGLGSELIRRAGASEVFGVDTREELIGWADSHVGSKTLHFTTIPDGPTLPFEEGRFELVIAVNPSHLLGRDHFLEIARVLGASKHCILVRNESLGPNLAWTLPRYERAPNPVSVEPVDSDFLDDRFGPSLDFRETPFLGFTFQAHSYEKHASHWGEPDTTFSAEERRESLSTTVVHVFGEDIKTPTRKIIEFPYGLIASSSSAYLHNQQREAENLRGLRETLERQLDNKEKLLGSLEQEVHNLRHQLSETRQRLDEARSQPFGKDDAPTNPLLVLPDVLEQQQQRETYIQDLLTSLSAWKAHAEQLRQQVAHRPAPRPVLGQQATAHLDVLEQTVSLQEAELARLQTEEVAAMEAEARATAELRERNKRNAELQKQLEDSEEQLRQFSVEVEDMLKTNHRLQRKAEKLEERLAEFDNKELKTRQDSVSLEQQIRDKSSKLQAFEREKMGFKIELTALQKENTRLIQAKTELDRVLAKEETQKKNLTDDLQRRDDEIKELKNTLAALKEAHSKTTAQAEMSIGKNTEKPDEKDEKPRKTTEKKTKKTTRKAVKDKTASKKPSKESAPKEKTTKEKTAKKTAKNTASTTKASKEKGTKHKVGVKKAAKNTASQKKAPAKKSAADGPLFEQLDSPNKSRKRAAKPTEK